MGVKDLWPILESTAVTNPLCSLSGKRVAVDLGFWIVQSKCVSGLNKSRKPHLKNLFHRVSHLVTNEIMPIFVMDGKPPGLKSVAIRKRLKKEKNLAQGGADETITRSNFNHCQKECQQLLESLGIPCIVSSGEAEALCAFLNANGVVDGCITDDNDAFLYGAKIVYRYFSSTPTDAHVKEYCLSEIHKELGLNREKLIALALLLGCDYVDGVPTIGKETAMKFLKETQCSSIFQRFNDWKNLNKEELFPMYSNGLDQRITHCTRCCHPGRQSDHRQNGCFYCNSEMTCYLPKAGDKCSCEFHKNVEARESVKMEWKVYQAMKDTKHSLNDEVIAEYLSFTDQIPNKQKLSWTKPDILSLQDKMFNWLGWTPDYTFKKALPLITSWQISRLSHCESTKVDSDKFSFTPIRIVRLQTKLKKQFFKVLWKFNDENEIDVCYNKDIEEDMCTLEDRNSFVKAYKEVVDTFLEKEEDKKRAAEERKSKKRVGTRNRKKPTLSSPVTSHKILDFFLPVASCSQESSILSVTRSRKRQADVNNYETISNPKVIALGWTPEWETLNCKLSFA